MQLKFNVVYFAHFLV